LRNKVSERPVERIAFLQEYRNRPWTLKEMVPEVANKGYRAAAFAVRIGQEEFLADLAGEAAKVGLEVMAFTGFMKYQDAWLKDHPDQRLVFGPDGGALDRDRVRVNWGCPFQPAFQERYMAFLRALGRIPNMAEVWIDDEACLGFDEPRLGCYCPVCRADWSKEFGGEIPKPPFRDRREKARFVHWRFRRWNRVHQQMKEVLSADHPVRAVFLSSPAGCIGLNPWVSGVDISGMVEGIDGVMTDPYYTFHDVLRFTGSMPREVYLSEYCRYLRGVVGEGKRAEVCAQGFSHPTFTRPLDERDGWWAGIVPSALGMDGVTAYTYPLQRISPMRGTYEESFRLDACFARTRPVDFAAVVDSLETQCFHVDAAKGAASWQQSRMMPVAEVMRRHALPYVYISSRRLKQEGLERWPVLILPGVSCLGLAARDRLREHVASGGSLVACGETATRDEVGRPMDDPFMKDVFGVASQAPGTDCLQFSAAGDHPAFADIPWPDEITGQYMGGVNYPVLGLGYAVEAVASDKTQVLAVFNDDAGRAAGRPALTRRSFGKGAAIFCAGVPTRTFLRREFQRDVLNYAGRVLAHSIRDAAGDRLPLRAKHFPPRVPMQELRPLDSRWMPTAEFLPCCGPDLYLATVPSYFKEPMSFQIEAILPEGKTCPEVRELVSDRPVANVRREGNRVEIDADLGSNDCIKVFAFFLK